MLLLRMRMMLVRIMVGRSLPGLTTVFFCRILLGIEERIGQGDNFHFRIKLRVDHELHRHFLLFTRLECLLAEAEAFGLLEVRPRLVWRNTGYGLAGNGIAGSVPGVEHGNGRLTDLDGHLLAHGVFRLG